MDTESVADQGILRTARVAEAEFLTELAIRSKGHWGYDSEFLRDCRFELTVTPEFVSLNTVVVVEANGTVAGFYSLEEKSESDVELVHLFVEPKEIGLSYGKQLFKHAAETSRDLGYQVMLITSDPYAEPFYKAMGAERIGQVDSAVIPGRTLPLLRFNLFVIF